MRESVAIVGGGVAGLTAAHELVERGFDVTVYERRSLFGGKAASYRFGADGATPSSGGRPGEHGFRFFPAWYHHLTHTMERIPYHRPNGGRQTVADNLVSVESNLLTWFGRPSVALPVHLPRSRAEVATAAQFVAEFRKLGLSPGEVLLFSGKMLEFLSLSDEQRAARFESVSWWNFLDCDHPERSSAYRDLVRATTLTMVAAKAEDASAYTIGRLAARTFLDALTSVDRVLNGPTNEVWIEPWVAHLRARGVKFLCERELGAIEFDGEGRRVKRLMMEKVATARARRLRRFLARCRTKDPVRILETSKAGDSGLQDEPFQGQFDKLVQSIRELSSEEGRELARRCGDASPSLWTGDGKKPGRGEIDKLEAALAAFEVEANPAVNGNAKDEASQKDEVKADYFVLALPLEQLAYYVNRSATLVHLAPELKKVVRLARHMDWMAGIQFYLSSPCDLAPGHLVGLDSPWALTAIEQTQFWRDVTLPRDVKAILSVDIAAWDKVGIKTRKEAYNCTREEVAKEVWAQLQKMVNKSARPDLLRDEMLVGGAFKEGVSYHLDDSIVDIQDRKKQAFYERARGVRFNTLDLVDQSGEDGPADGAENYMWGPRLLFNAEPLLINRVGSRRLRPEAKTSIDNLFLAGDFVKTETDLACMEAANEAARRAVNGILDASASKEPHCRLWPFAPSRGIGDAIRGLMGMYRGFESAARGVASLQNRFWSGLAGGLTRLQGSARDGTNLGEDDYLSKR